MSEQALRFIVRTPVEVVVEWPVASVRVPAETGQVGLRARVEPMVLAVEPGLVLVRRNGAYWFVGTAGGLLRCDGIVATLLTPLAISGEDEETVLNALEEALAKPSVEMEAREKLGHLQTSILRELRQGGNESTKQTIR